MAGIDRSAQAQEPVSSGADQRRTVYRFPASSRDRQLHGICMARRVMLGVYSSRKAGEPWAVSLTVQNNGGDRTEHFSAIDARALSHALVLAANAADALAQQEGGAA